MELLLRKLGFLELELAGFVPILLELALLLRKL
jgi:hypothetical protein